MINSALCKYKYVDFIHVPKHLLTFGTRIRMLKNPGLCKKVLCTKGTIHSFNYSLVKNRYTALLKQLSALQKNENLIPQLDKLEYFKIMQLPDSRQVFAEAVINRLRQLK